MVGQEMYDAFVEESRKIGVFGHGFTYGGHPLGCALGAKAIEIYQKRGVLENVRGLEPQFLARLARIADHPLVGEVRGTGLIGGVELVASKTARTPFDSALAIGPRCVAHAQKHGAILRAVGDTVALCPPMIISEEELDQLFDCLDAALNDTLAELPAGMLKD